MRSTKMIARESLTMWKHTSRTAIYVSGRGHIYCTKKQETGRRKKEKKGKERKNMIRVGDGLWKCSTELRWQRDTYMEWKETSTIWEEGRPRLRELLRDSDPGECETVRWSEPATLDLVVMKVHGMMSQKKGFQCLRDYIEPQRHVHISCVLIILVHIYLFTTND